MIKSRRPAEYWRTAFFHDCDTARERQRVFHHGFRVDEYGDAPSFTRVVTGFSWFPIKLLVVAGCVLFLAAMIDPELRWPGFVIAILMCSVPALVVAQDSEVMPYC